MLRASGTLFSMPGYLLASLILRSSVRRRAAVVDSQKLSSFIGIDSPFNRSFHHTFPEQHLLSRSGLKNGSSNLSFGVIGNGNPCRIVKRFGGFLFGID